jgi:hypothetical protein
MIEQLSNIFPQFNNCLSILTDKHVYVFENNETQKGEFVSAKQNYHLHIENKTNGQFYFLQNDDCIMINEKNGQCDYLIFNENEINFTEIKVAKGNLKNHRKDAYKQIENTFKFYSNAITFSNKILLNALVCFPSKRRIVKPSESTKRKEFKNKYNIALRTGNYLLLE